jgi:hypothetical protein
MSTEPVQERALLITPWHRHHRLIALAILLCAVLLANALPGWAQRVVTVYPGQNLQSLVNNNGSSTTFSFTPGIYYHQSIVPKSYDSFIGQSGAILSGGTRLTSFQQNGSYWTAKAAVAQAASYPGRCASATPACALPEDLFFDNIPRRRVTSLSAVGPGKWYLNYSTGTIYMGDSPWGRTVELSVLRSAFSGTATNVTIQGLTIEKYASLAQTGAINNGGAGSSWTLEGNQVRFNHALGIQFADRSYVHNNHVYSNGEMGMAGTGTNITVENNEIAYNNYAGFLRYWEAGGAKFSGCRDVTFRYNYCHHNAGPGFWTDIDCQYVLCDSNRSTANTEAGVFAELSSNITISNNDIWNDAYNPDGSGPWWGAGILMFDTSDSSVYFNKVSYCMNGIVGILANRGSAPNGQPYTFKNVNVNGNTIYQATGTATGITIEGTGYDNSVYTSWNNQFRNNNFTLSTSSYKYIWWLGHPMTFSDWISALSGQ